MPIIDFHNHYYPPEYIKAIEQGPSAVRITYDDEKNPRLHYPGDYNIAVRGHRDIDYRIAGNGRTGNRYGRDYSYHARHAY